MTTCTSTPPSSGLGWLGYVAALGQSDSTPSSTDSTCDESHVSGELVSTSGRWPSDPGPVLLWAFIVLGVGCYLLLRLITLI
jgi:hypothetical protein